MITCKACNLIKNSIEFYKHPTNKSGLSGICKKCQFNKWKLRQDARTSLKKQQDQIKNIEYCKNRQNNLSLEEKQQLKIKNKKWSDSRSKEKIESDKERKRIKKKQKYDNDLIFKTKEILRARLNRAIKNKQKSGSAVDDLGCSIENFISHIESQFEPWMTWENRGRYNKNIKTWQIDHIIPLDSFNLEVKEDFLKANNYTNLRPLCARENRYKSNKVFKSKEVIDG